MDHEDVLRNYMADYDDLMEQKAIYDKNYVTVDSDIPTLNFFDTDIGKCDLMTKDNKQYIGFRHATESDGKERIERFASKYNKEKYQLKYGKYSTEDWKGTTELYLRREKSYLLRCMDFVISRGEYEVRDNILILKDEDLNCEYELLIGEDCLMSKRIPT